ncbi:MAG TPA: hypothetical protein VKD70_01445 [Candidatus Acidoferrum sp.]|nr:hypothetical protein [Candidatus Acidoferrum sp.]
MDANQKTKFEVIMVYDAYVVTWFLFIFMVYKMAPTERIISSLVLLGFVVGAVYAIVAGFMLRRKFLAQSPEALHGNPPEARWRLGNIVSFSCAQCVTILGVALKMLGASWLVAGIFFAVGLGFLLLWRPRRGLWDSLRIPL